MPVPPGLVVRCHRYAECVPQRASEEPDTLCEVAITLKSRCIKTSQSLFDPERSIWTLEHFEELGQRFLQQPDTGSASLLEALADQLAGTSPAAKQLTAELLYIHFLISVYFEPRKKREIVETVLSWVPDPPVLDAELDAGFDSGLVIPGTFSRTHCHSSLGYLIRFGRAWCEQDSGVAMRRWTDPYVFKVFLWMLPFKYVGSERVALSNQRLALWYLIIWLQTGHRYPDFEKLYRSPDRDDPSVVGRSQ
jgi:hypothetical protein